MLTELPPGRLDDLAEPLRNTLRAVRDAARACIAAHRPGTRRPEGRSSPTPPPTNSPAPCSTTPTTPPTACWAPLTRTKHTAGTSCGSPASMTAPHPLRVAPLGVGGLLRERLFGQHTTVLTSATLTLGGAFDTLARQWGLPPVSSVARKAEGTATDKEPPSDPQQSEVDRTGRRLAVRCTSAAASSTWPSTCRPPAATASPTPYLTELRELVEAAGGRTLGLFSSMRAAKQATEVLRDRLDHPILCQGEDATSLLVTKFAEDPRTCLFGTLSLWQGVDVPGPSLQLVVVDRIPFPRPDDPLASARQRAVAARGGNGFLTVAATHAALLLAQGAGRLLRSMGDKGVVAILDSAAGHRPLRQFPAGLPAAVLVHDRSGGRAWRAAQAGRGGAGRLTGYRAGSIPRRTLPSVER